MNFSNNTVRTIFTVILTAILGVGIVSTFNDEDKLQALCGYPLPSPYYRLGTYLYKMELLKNDPAWEANKNVKKVRLPDGSVDLSAMKAHIVSKGVMTEREFDTTMAELSDAGLKVVGKTQFSASQLNKWAQVIDECQAYREEKAKPVIVATST